ncbi:hypothetical protein BDZ97DRAFT_1786421, partial [Flammula alnicola]
IMVASIHSFRTKTTSANSLLQLSHLIEDLSYSIHMDGHLNTQYLSRFMQEKYPDQHSSTALSVLNGILDAALLLPTLFPTHMIPYLDARHPELQLSMTQIKCLLAHQILNTLKQPKGNTWGCTFVCWYSEPQPLESAVSGYLSFLFDYFSMPLDDTTRMTYQYYTNPSKGPEEELTVWMGSTSHLVFDHLVIEPTSTRTVSFPHHSVPCTLVASNQSPGFGASCTQEELVTGACPPLLLLGALLISPPVSSQAALLAHGHVPISHWRGQGREARSLGTFTISAHTFLFLDASELDISSQSSTTLTDLHPKYLLRDLHKAYTGFLALAHLKIEKISSPLWGAGTFGGDPIVKSLILTMAAARAGIVLHLSVDEDRAYEVGERMEGSEGPLTVVSILQHLKQKCRLMTVADVMRRLCSEDIMNCCDGLDHGIIPLTNFQRDNFLKLCSIGPCCGEESSLLPVKILYDYNPISINLAAPISSTCTDCGSSI